MCLFDPRLCLKLRDLGVAAGGAYGTQYGGDVIFAVPSLAEKGYMDIRVEVTAKGGHSSVPPRHTVRCTVFPLLNMTVDDEPL